MRVLVVADKSGVGRVKPFAWGDHAGEEFWIDKTKFRVTSDNRIKLGKRFMDKYGFLRSDGRRAIILETGARYFSINDLPKELKVDRPKKVSEKGSYLVQGAEILSGEPFEKWYEKKTGDRVPYKVGAEEDYEILKAFDGPDLYTGGF